MSRTVRLLRPGRIDYHTAWAWQHRAADDLRGGGPESLALLDHPPVYTLGRRADRAHLLTDPERLLALGASVVDSDRGGDITFHGPGQIVGYPILDLRGRGLGAIEYVRALEETIVRVLTRFGIDGRAVPGRPGVWTRGQPQRAAKIAAIGVRVQHGVSMHGFALNVATDLAWFDHIVPCGIADAGVTSMERLLGVAPDRDDVERALAEAFAERFDSQLVDVGSEEVAAQIDR